MKKRTLFFVLLLLSTLTASAQTLINGLYYDGFDLSTKTVKVTKNPNNYFGSVVIPSTVVYRSATYNVTEIGESAFNSCSNMTSVTIPNSVIEIGDSAFVNCTGLTKITIPNSITSIGYGAFYGCSGLTAVHISDIAAWCNIKFKVKFPEINNIHFYSNPLYIAEHLFMNGKEIKDLVIPDGVTYIGEGAFAHSRGLTSVTIPNSVTSIEADAFCSCSSLTEVTIPNSVTSIEKYAFVACSSLKTLTIGSNVTSIGYGAFYNCHGLTSMTIPNSVTSIGGKAFFFCDGLTSIFIGSGVKTIGNYAFQNCSQLGHVYCYADDIPMTESNAFIGSSIEYVTLHVPSELIDEYKITEPWSGFGAFEELLMPRCATPTVDIVDGKVTLSCETEGVEYDYVISTTHVKTSDEVVTTPAKLMITVIATKDGYEPSDAATKTFDKSILVGTSGIRGDVNLDGEIGMPDVMFIVNYILNGKFPDE